MSRFHSLTIKDKIQETQEAVSLVFEVPEELRTHYRFKAGQHVTLSTTIDEMVCKRAYSLSVGENTDELRVTIKAIKNGLFSNYAVKELKKGDSIEVSAPEGRFTLPEAKESQNYLAFAAGSGITPLFSMASTVLAACEKSTFNLVYGNKSPEQTILKKEITELIAAYPERFRVFYAFSQMAVLGHHQGRIDTGLAINVLHAIGKVNHVLLCGPEAMITSLDAILKVQGLSKSQISYELFFSSATQNKETADGAVADEIANTDEPTEKAEIKATILLDDEEEKITFDKSKNLLSAVLDAGLDAPHSCKAGVCSSCMARVTKGTVTMTGNNILDEDEVEEGLILSCIAHAESDEIELDFDDV